MLEFINQKDNHVYKYHKFKFSTIMDKKLRKEDQLLLLHNGVQDNQLVKLLTEMLE